MGVRPVDGKLHEKYTDVGPKAQMVKMKSTPRGGRRSLMLRAEAVESEAKNCDHSKHSSLLTLRELYKAS